MSALPSERWEPVLDALLHSPAGLFTDIDGTLSPVAPTPEEARVLPQATEALAALAGRLEVVAAITGRAAEYAREMVGVPGLAYAGNHGLEELVDGATRLVPEAEPYAGRVAETFGRVRDAISVPGILWEDKGITGSVHYRLAPDPQAARERIVEVLAPAATEAGLTLHEGRMIVELRPALALGKGAAAWRLIQRHGLRGCAFLGDDVTDADAFGVLREMREKGEVTAVCIGVLSEETPPPVIELSDVTVEGVPGAVELLHWLARNL